jgi:hypothetical protein
VLEVLKREWQRWDEASRAALEARDRARLEVLRGDFASAGAHAAAWEEALGEDNREVLHADAIRLGLQIALEAGRSADALALVHRYEARHAAWSLDPFAPDESIQIDALSYSAGFIDRREFIKRRGTWLARNERRTLVGASSGPSDRWFQAYATPCVTPDDAADALATLTGPPPSRFFETGADAVVAEMYRLAGKTDEAVRSFSRQVRSCTALNEPFDSTLASYRLGELLESSGDRTGACQQYGIVLARWGHAVPASRTASDAARHATSLHCPR